MTEDRLFLNKRTKAADFNFGYETAAVFDNMLNRSIPLYKELQRMMGEIAAEYSHENSVIYDLGCSTGITLEVLQDSIKKKIKLVGVDYSQAMLDKCRERFTKKSDVHDLELVCADLNEPMKIYNASVVVLNLTLQFIRPVNRDVLIRSIWEGLRDGGCLILVEKVLGESPGLKRLFIKLHYDMKKRQGYSGLEIAQKREALENMLIPYRIEENKQLLTRNGFKEFDIFFKWYNFCGMLAVK